MTSIPPPPSEPPAFPTPPGGSIPPPPVGVPLPIPHGGYGAPVASPADRIRYAWQRRSETDYVFDFWTAFGWTLLTCGIYWFYVMYQLVRRSRDHNARRAELLDAATAFAWEQANARGQADELRPHFERISGHLGTLRRIASEFRDPTAWLAIAIVTSLFGANLIVLWIVYILLDGDRAAHDAAEGAIEAELSAVYAQLGAPITPPEPSRMQGRHNYVARIIVSIVTCGFYTLWWTADVMREGNDHFRHNWRWEDDLAASVQQLLGIAR